MYCTEQRFKWQVVPKYPNTLPKLAAAIDEFPLVLVLVSYVQNVHFVCLAVVWRLVVYNMYGGTRSHYNLRDTIPVIAPVFSFIVRHYADGGTYTQI